MDEVEVDPRAEAMAQRRASELRVPWDHQPNWWRWARIEEYTQYLAVADLVDPLRQCRVPAGRSTALVHKSLFDSVLAQRNEVQAELSALKKKLGELSES